jgi:hypothetical protein
MAESRWCFALLAAELHYYVLGTSIRTCLLLSYKYMLFVYAERATLVGEDMRCGKGVALTFVFRPHSGGDGVVMIRPYKS